nr:unnamed protein product [Digitaria exilis]
MRIQAEESTSMVMDTGLHELCALLPDPSATATGATNFLVLHSCCTRWTRIEMAVPTEVVTRRHRGGFNRRRAARDAGRRRRLARVEPSGTEETEEEEK